MSQRVLVTNREWAVRTRDRGARFIKPLTGEIADVEAGTLVLLRQFAFPADPEDVARQLSGDSGIAAELLQRIDELVDVGLLIAHDDVYSGPRPTGGPSPRIVDTVLVDYAAVGSVAARWAS